MFHLRGYGFSHVPCFPDNVDAQGTNSLWDAYLIVIVWEQASGKFALSEPANTLVLLVRKQMEGVS